MKWTTSVKCLDNSRFILVGSGAKQNNFFVIENTASNKLTAPADYVPAENSLQIRSAFTLPNPIYHLSVSGNYMATAGPDGCIQIYQVDKDGIAKKGGGLSHLTEIALSDTSLSQLRISPPGVSLGTVRVNHTELCPSGENGTPEKLIATQGRKIYLSDIATGQVLGSETLGIDTVYKASFSPHSPSGSLICTGGNDRVLYILDARLLGKSSACIAMKYPKAHRSTISDSKFNQFVPYWIASGGEGGVVKIWDIRFLKGPAARIDGHYGVVNSICWSTTHCDILATGATDRSWKAWSLSSSNLSARYPRADAFVDCPGAEWEGASPSGHTDSRVAFGGKLLAEYQADLSGPIVSISASTYHADSFYSVSSMGDVSCHTLRADIFEEITLHRFEESYARDVEVAVKARDLSTAFSKVINISRTQRAEGELLANLEKDLVNLCTVRPSTKPESWTRANMSSTVNDHEEMMEAFKKDLDDYSYSLPPRFGDFGNWTEHISPLLRLEYDFIILRAKIVSDILIGNWKNILRIESTIAECMDLSCQFMDPSTLNAIADLTLSNSFAKAMSMMVNFMTVICLDAKLNPIDFTDTLGRVLFPTVFDGEVWLPTSPIDDEKPLTATLIAQRQDLHSNYIEQSKAKPKTSGRSASVIDRPSRKSRLEIKPVTKVLSFDEQKVAKMAALKDFFPILRSASSVLTLEAKLVKLVDEMKKTSELDILLLDTDLIDTMQKWDLNTGGGRKNFTGTANLVSSTGLQVPMYERTFSMFTNRMYLEALLRREQYLTFFITCLDLFFTYQDFESSNYFMKCIEEEGLKRFKNAVCEVAISEANTTISKALLEYKMTPHSSKVIELGCNAIKILKDPICLVIKVTSAFMHVSELKYKNEFGILLGRTFTTLTNSMGQMNALLAKVLDVFDRIARNIQSVKEIVLSFHDTLREAIRLLPLSSEKRPTIQSDKIMTGYATHEDAFALLDRLFRNYVKVLDNA